MEHREELAKERKDSRVERWANEQKVMKGHQDSHQIMQAALDSGLINKKFTIGELHSKLPVSTDLRNRWYVLCGGSFCLVVSNNQWLKNPEPDHSNQQADSEAHTYSPK